MTNFTIKDNEVLNCRKEGIDCKLGSSNGVVEGNYIHDAIIWTWAPNGNTQEYKQPGIYIDSIGKLQYDITAKSNVIHDMPRGIVIGSEREIVGLAVKDITIENNLCYKIARSVVTLDDPWTPEGSTEHQQIWENITIKNNTFLHKYTETQYGPIPTISITKVHKPGQVKNVKVYNNVFDFDEDNYPASIPSMSFVVFSTRNFDETVAAITKSNNLFRIRDTSHGGNPVMVGANPYGDPKFHNRSNDDYSIRSDSPARGQSNAVATLTAINNPFISANLSTNGTWRGVPADVGAFDWGF